MFVELGASAGIIRNLPLGIFQKISILSQNLPTGMTQNLPTGKAKNLSSVMTQNVSTVMAQSPGVTLVVYPPSDHLIF